MARRQPPPNDPLINLFDASPIAIVAVDLDEHVTMWNRAAEDTLGLSPAELSGKPFRLSTGADESRFTDLRNNILRNERVHQADFSYTRKDASVIDLSVSAAALRDQKGTVTGIVYLIDDVTEMSRMREAVRRSERRYRDLFENANDMVFTLDMAGRFTSVNKKTEEILGYNREELLGKGIETAAVSGSENDVRATLLDSEPEALSNPREFELESKDGSIVPLEVTTRVVYESGQAIGIQAILRDIRERRRFQSQLQQANKMDALGRLAGGVAHDFNNLLTVIAGYAQLHLAQLGDDEPTRQYVLPIITAADRAATLTRQLLAFSKKQTIRPQILNPGRLVQDLGKMMGRLIGENIELIVNIDQDVGNIKADPGQIEQLMINLLINARDAMPSGGKLFINVSNVVIGQMHAQRHVQIKPGDYVMLAVRDTGLGMDQEAQDRVFEPFFTTKDVGESSGLGLAMVYGVVKQNDGHIWLYSELGRGTTFKIYLPRVFDGLSSVATQETQPTRAAAETILIVEDEKTLQLVVESILSGWGYTTLTASNGQEALQIYREYPEQIHLVITDVVMPGMSGRELVRQIRELSRNTRFLYMSGYPGEPGSENAAPDESIPYIEKPFTPSQLFEYLREIFEE